MSYDYLLGRVKTYVEELQMEVDAAIKKAKVPSDAIEWIKAELAAPIEVVDPPTAISDEAERRSYCRPYEVPHPNQHYLAGFERYAIDCRKWSRAVVHQGDASLREVSATLVSHLPDPKKNDEFVVKGLVLGYVQSGKTANMAALICRAADHGYRLVIVLAGLYNDLRAQTQDRLDHDIVGRSDDNEGEFVKHSSKLATWGRLTSTGLAGDFAAGTINEAASDNPRIAVIKKHPVIIRRLIKWLDEQPGEKTQPVLIIDDEADQASINSNYGKYDDDGAEVSPTSTNEAIRALINTFVRCAYVGFTATPFANVLIDVDDEDDLFPADFIVSLHEPPGYFGARQLFGFGLTPSALSPDATRKSELPVVRAIDEEEGEALSSVSRDQETSPRVLREALLAFLLSSAARLARQQDKHFTMLVHPSGLRDDHIRFFDVLKKDVARLKTQLKQLDLFTALKDELRSLWEKDFASTTRAANGPALTFHTVQRHLGRVIQEVEVKLIHMGSSDVLEYRDGGAPRRYIVVGGNRLSRGLTLEGLSISLFIRSTKAYDTLLQMGRWFGYRSGYADLTRIYVDEGTANDFADLARIEAELRADLAKYGDGKMKPRDLVPMIREHERLLPTSPQKMGAAKKNQKILRSVKQVVRFPFDKPGAIEGNIATARSFLVELGEADEKSGDWWVWRRRSAADVLELVRRYEFAKVPVMNRRVVTAAIEALPREVDWDIVIPRANERGGFEWLPGRTTGMLTRSPYTPSSIKVLREQEDLKQWEADKERAKAALFFYVVNQNTTAGPIAFKNKKHPLVGLAFAFPEEDLMAGRVERPPAGYIKQPNSAKKKAQKKERA